MNYTDEQLAIFQHLKETDEHLIVNAKAGSGKTSTLIKGLSYLRGTTSFQAFNKSIATEIQAKVNKDLGFNGALNVAVSTVHSHGLSSFRRSGKKPQILSGKVAFMLKDWMKANLGDDDDMHRNGYHVSRMVSYAKSAGFGLDSVAENFPKINDLDAWQQLMDHYNLEEELVGDVSPESVIELAQKILLESNRRLTAVDFDDMIYLPLLLNLPIPTYKNVLLDESQDINNTRRELAFRSIAPGGRIIAVGDPNQAIYGFTGASVDSLHQIQKRSGALELPLSICWRCDAEIIAEAQRYVPGIRARPDAPAGQVTRITWGTKAEPGTVDFPSLPQPGDAILCRLNKPNVAVCLGLIRRGVRAKIEGKDIGKKILSHIHKSSPGYEFDKLYDIATNLEDYRKVEVEKMVKKEKSEASIALMEDEIEAAILVTERAMEQDGAHAGYNSVARLFEDLFGDDIPPSGVVTLSSVHKSKGREWPTVYILGFSDYMPFHLATMDWEKEQEENLIYVAITRAEKNLILVNGVQSAIDRGLHRESN